METVDYLKLAEQYASFLVAAGGVSITVLTLVLTLGSDTNAPARVNSRSFLVAALVVATVTCFVGAHMMAETAAFIQFHNHSQPPLLTGDRLFLLASTNIFVAIILILFALVLLPTTSRRVHAASMAPVSTGVFVLIVIGGVYWMVLATQYRMPVPRGWLINVVAIAVGLGWGTLLPRSKKWLLWFTFLPSALSVFVCLFWFAWIFKEGDTERLHGARVKDIWFFSLAITLSYASLCVAGLKVKRELEWREWRLRNEDVLKKCRLPEIVLRSRSHWRDFLNHGRLEDSSLLERNEELSKFKVEDLSKIEMKHLKAFLESELSQRERKSMKIISLLESELRDDG